MPDYRQTGETEESSMSEEKQESVVEKKPVYFVIKDPNEDRGEPIRDLGEAKRLANVENGARCSVSAVRPLVLELDDDNYRFTLNGQAIKSGEKLSETGVWALMANHTSLPTRNLPAPIARRKC